MSLNFPNASRSYDLTRRAVRFWGYDSTMEFTFFATEEALRHVQPAMEANESGALQAFDGHRPLIYAAATKAYAKGRKSTYDLSRGDF